jgi:hypothetical protein
MATTPNKPRISKTGLTSGGRIGLYSNSKEATDLDPSLINYIPGNSLTALYLTQADLDNDDVSIDDSVDIDVELDDPDVSGVEGNTFGSSTPSLSDIEIVSNTVVYDAAGNPSVALVIKVKNSSGTILKGMNARLELV